MWFFRNLWSYHISLPPAGMQPYAWVGSSLWRNDTQVHIARCERQIFPSWTGSLDDRSQGSQILQQLPSWLLRWGDDKSGMLSVCGSMVSPHMEPQMWDFSCKCPAPAVDDLMLWERWSPTSDCSSSSSTWWSLGSTSNGKWGRKGKSARWNSAPCLQSLTKSTWEYREYPFHLVHCRSSAFLFWIWMALKAGLW